MLPNHLQLSCHAFLAFRREDYLHIFTEERMVLVPLEYLERLLRLDPREDGVKVWEKTLDYAQIVLGKLSAALDSLRHKMHMSDKERFFLLRKRYYFLSLETLYRLCGVYTLSAKTMNSIEGRALSQLLDNN